MQTAQKPSPADEVVWRWLGRVDYPAAFRAMQQFTDTRTPETRDEIWLLEHSPVFTMGLKGRGGARTHIQDIPLAYTDRGGDITYHGPGQIVAYILMDLRRRGWGPKLWPDTGSRPSGARARPGCTWPGPRSPRSACACAWVPATMALR